MAPRTSGQSLRRLSPGRSGNLRRLLGSLAEPLLRAAEAERARGRLSSAAVGAFRDGK
jgi:hypothetical protein